MARTIIEDFGRNESHKFIQVTMHEGQHKASIMIIIHLTASNKTISQLVEKRTQNLRKTIADIRRGNIISARQARRSA
jgi:hypothetical protein